MKSVENLLEILPKIRFRIVSASNSNFYIHSKFLATNAYNGYLYNSYQIHPRTSIPQIISYSFISFNRSNSEHKPTYKNSSIMTNSSDYKRVFNHFDRDGNGMISPSELQHCVGLIWNEEILLEEVEVVVESSNGNNGNLGFEDFVGLMESTKEDEKLEDLRKAFRMYEMDGIDCITPKSLNRMLNRLGESRSVDECAGMISRFDLNGDGVLNFDEFKQMML
ncbi:hypothetical protein Lser_V15G40971 [Lactuca serriola]